MGLWEILGHPVTFIVSVSVVGFNVVRVVLVLQDIDWEKLTSQWQKIAIGIEPIVWILLFSVILGIMWVVFISDFPFRWLFLLGLVPGLGVSAYLGFKRSKERPAKQTWMHWVGLTYMTLVIGLFLIEPLTALEDNIRNSCLSRSPANLSGAVAAGDVRCVAHWLQEGPFEVGDEDLPPLLVAAESKNAHVLGLLLASGEFDPNLAAKDGDLPLHVAIRSQRPDIVCQLLRYGGNMNIPNARFETPLDIAEKGNYAELMTLLKSSSCLPVTTQ